MRLGKDLVAASDGSCRGPEDAAYNGRSCTGTAILIVTTIRIVIAAAMLGLPSMAGAQEPIPQSISTPDKVESRLGPLEFKDGAPNAATVAKVYDNIDYTHAYNALVNTMQGVSIAAIRKGMASIGVKDASSRSCASYSRTIQTWRSCRGGIS
jgi:hypothetical protein